MTRIYMIMIMRDNWNSNNDTFNDSNTIKDGHDKINDKITISTIRITMISVFNLTFIGYIIKRYKYKSYRWFR